MVTLYQASLLFDDLSKGGTKLGVGIHSAVEVVGIEKGENYVDINFSKDGKVMNKRLWEATGNYPRKDKDGKVLETQAQAIEREEKLNLSNIAKLMTIFLSKETVETFKASFKGDIVYDDFVTKAIVLLKPKLGTKKVNLKVIYDSDGVYPTLGNFPSGDSAYLEEHVEGQEPTLTYSKYELDNRVKPKASVVKKDDKLDSIYD